jgi:hypothetical protein
MLRLRLIFEAKRLKAEGHSTLASRAETALNHVTHELMRLGAFK